MNERMPDQGKLRHCKMSSLHSKGKQNCGGYSKHSQHEPANNGIEDIKSDQSKMRHPKQQGVLYTAVEEMCSQCEHDIEYQHVLMKCQGMAVPKTEDRHCLANSQ
ncbi:unnamed protein product, partial [Lymnaea stagnalis]